MKKDNLIGHFSDPPGQPGTPEIVDWDVDRVDLKWAAPKFNGGAPISGYIIEKKERFGGNWEEILTTEVKALIYEFSLLHLELLCLIVLLCLH